MICINNRVRPRCYPKSSHRFSTEIDDEHIENHARWRARRTIRLHWLPLLAQGSIIIIIIVLGALIRGWPSTMTWALGVIAGIGLITSGLAIVRVAAAARNMVRMIEQATR